MRPGKASTAHARQHRELGAPGNDDFWGWGRVDSYTSVSGSIKISPMSFTVTRGVLQSGGLPELRFSDNTWLTVLHVPPVPFSEPTAHVVVEGTAGCDTASTVGFRFESHSTSVQSIPMRQRLELYNFTANQWEIVDERTASPVDAVVEVTFTTSMSAPSRFIQPGTCLMRARMGWFLRVRMGLDGPGSDAQAPFWVARIDEATWRYMP